jgi:hypothetical protein
MKAVVERAMRATGVSLPGTVVSYNAAAQTCVVRPGVYRLIPSLEDMDVDEVEEIPALQDVPVCWPRGRGFSCVGTLAAGDPVLLICQDRDIAGWQRTGQPAEPDDARVHHWQSAVAIPGLVPNANPIPVPTDAAALASKVDLLIGVLKTVLAGAASDTAVKIGTAFPNVPAATPADVSLGVTTASTVLKLGS